MHRLIVILILMYPTESFGQLVNGEELRKAIYYDSILSGMRLRDVESVEKVIGTSENMMNSDTEQAEVVSSNSAQLLTMIFHPGDVINQFSQFKVEYNAKNVKSSYKINGKEFVSGKGIKLGISGSKVIAALGQPTSQDTDKGLVHYYYKQDGEGLYFGHYWLENGKLVKFWFGEEYP